MRGVDATTWKIVPDRSAHLLAHCFRAPSGSERVTTTMVGSRSCATEVDPTGRVWTAGVRLRPGAIGPLTGLDASEFTDVAATFGAVWGARGDRRARAISSERDPAKVAHLLIDTVAEAASGRSRGWVARAFDVAVRSRPQAPVSELSELLGIAPRTLRRRCRDATGLAPKRHLRIARLHASIDRARNGPSTPWGRIAVACGFSDQAHLVREFRDLVGETPEAFRARGRQAVSYKSCVRNRGNFPSVPTAFNGA